MFLVLPTSAQENSNEKSAKDTVTVNKTVIDNCAKALDELAVYDKLLEAKQTEINVLKERLELEKEKSQLLFDLSETRKNQAASLTEANNALKEALSLKESIIQNQSKEIEILKKKGTKLSTIFKAVGVGIGIGLLLK